MTDKFNINNFKLDPEIKTKWLEALRSGDFKQGRGELRRNDEYCCLGVLCKIGDTVEEKFKVCEGDYRYTYEYHGEGDDARGGYLPARYTSMPRNVQLELGGMNDSGSTFSEIADIIEANL